MDKCKKCEKSESECTCDDGFLTSMIIGGITGSGIIGGLLGGNMLGGIIGDGLFGTDDNPFF